MRSAHYWAWCLVILAALVIQAMTVDVLPSVQQDDALVTDYGRLALDPSSDWSVTWLVAHDKPLLLWTYLGPLLAEIGFQAGGGTGPRIMALIGGAAAATMALAWLLSRSIPALAAMGLAAALLLDPLFTYSQRMARVDSWVIAFCLAACYLLRISRNRDPRSRNLCRLAAGACTALASVTWPSALLLFPLIALEFLSATPLRTGNVRAFLAGSGWFFAGAGSALVILLIPVREHIAILLGDLSTMVTQNVGSSRSGLQELTAVFDPALWLKSLKTFGKLLAPFLPVLALAGALYRRDAGLILVTAGTICLIFATLVYEFRLLYLLPYCIALAGGLFKPLHGSWIPRAALLAIVVWSAGISLGVRWVLAHEKGSVNSRERILQAARSAVGTGGHKVFLGFTFELYYSGRSLGWKIYTPYVYFNYDTPGAWTREMEYEPRDRFRQLLTGMDYAIFHQAKLTPELRSELAGSGLRYSRTVVVNEEFRHPVYSRPESRMQSAVLWFLRGEPSYGPYVIYSRGRPASRPGSSPITDSRVQQVNR